MWDSFRRHWDQAKTLKTAIQERRPCCTAKSLCGHQGGILDLDLYEHRRLKEIKISI